MSSSGIFQDVSESEGEEGREWDIFKDLIFFFAVLLSYFFNWVIFL